MIQQKGSLKRRSSSLFCLITAPRGGCGTEDCFSSVDVDDDDGHVVVTAVSGGETYQLSGCLARVAERGQHVTDLVLIDLGEQPVGA